ncbi:DODA-type extradiol aromatic ring-opening family dioxygenase [Magnetofaba australis]|uniref:Putative aromatic ring-opening dioxygenase n=1 Tax=Magnetofaba australis IT-1 TaxID=1434232 RepID=A0A1Y2K8Z5_9PROT|nr:class III extradiol ring-cleavage dioxygenase [Magnetofaba australis]OSM07089.1 putative aromatic ring-opening dioxygenase [Magnetofaba australis IT-1]
MTQEPLTGPLDSARVLFLSHGAPDILLRDTPASGFLRALGQRLPPLRGIVMVSAHWQAPRPTLTANGPLKTHHDFGGFDPELYRQRYPAQGSPALVAAVEHAFANAGAHLEVNTKRGLDHGAWIPLMMCLPEANIPIAQLSLSSGDFSDALALGRILAPLRQQGILLVGSGAVTHNLSLLQAPGAPPPLWAQEFANHLEQGLAVGDWDALARQTPALPNYAIAHPTPEHLAPLFVALGAAGDARAIHSLHDSWDYGALHMGAYAL